MSFQPPSGYEQQQFQHPGVERMKQQEQAQVAEHQREPCPDRILDDIGGAFAMGAVGGSLYYFITGMRNSPRGARFTGGISGIRNRAALIGGSFGVWGGLFSSFDCMLVYARQKEDPWNSIASGALTGGLLSIRQGMAAAGRAAIVGGLILAAIEGLGMWLSRAASPPPQGMAIPQFDAPMQPGQLPMPMQQQPKEK